MGKDVGRVVMWWKDLLPSKSKAECFSEIGVTYDTALPQTWLDEFVKLSGLDYHLVLATTVWAYPDGNYLGLPVSCCEEVKAAIDKTPMKGWY